MISVSGVRNGTRYQNAYSLEEYLGTVNPQRAHVGSVLTEVKSTTRLTLLGHFAPHSAVFPFVLRLLILLNNIPGFNAQ